MLSAIDRRLRKVETKRPRALFYLAWGRTVEEAAARKRGAPQGAENAVAMVWPDATPVPTSRWVTASDLSSRERALVQRAINAELAARGYRTP